MDNKQNKIEHPHKYVLKFTNSKQNHIYTHEHILTDVLSSLSHSFSEASLRVNFSSLLCANTAHDYVVGVVSKRVWLVVDVR